MELFENIKRNNLNPAKFNSSEYDFYNLSSRKNVDRIRIVLDAWYDNYCIKDKKELKSRIKSDFKPTFYELFIHELFRKLGFNLICHPALKNVTKKPDFLITGHKISFFLEAKITTDKSDEERAKENRINQIYDKLNKTNSPNFFINIEKISFKSTKQPSGKKIVKYLEKVLLLYNPNTKKLEGLKYLDRFNYEDSDIKLTISLIPKSKNLRGKPDIRTIGLFPTKSFWGGSEDAIKSALVKKATKYGNLNKPYLICINVLSEKGVDKFDVMNALFGSYIEDINQNPESEHRALKGNNGFFFKDNGKKYRNVSAVFITNVYPSNLHSVNYWLIKNPFASQDLPLEIFKLSRIEVIDNQIKEFKGITINKVLDIKENWLKNKLKAHNKRL